MNTEILILWFPGNMADILSQQGYANMTRLQGCPHVCLKGHPLYHGKPAGKSIYFCFVPGDHVSIKTKPQHQTCQNNIPLPNHTKCESRKQINGTVVLLIYLFI